MSSCNIIYVEQGEHPRLYSKSAFVSEFNWIMGQAPKKEFDCMARFRHRQSLRPVHITLLEQGVLIEYPQPERAVTPGQAAVLYMEDMCLGGGAVEYTSQTAGRAARKRRRPKCFKNFNQPCNSLKFPRNRGDGNRLKDSMPFEARAAASQYLYPLYKWCGIQNTRRSPL